MSVRSLAREAEVSPMTVSLALRDHPRISLAMREKIRALAARLGHVPNPRLGELMNEVRRGRRPELHAAIGLISLYPRSDATHYTPHLALSVRGARVRAEQLGYRIDDFWLGAPGMNPRRFRQILETRDIRGLLCLGAYEFDIPLPNELHSFAVVALGMSIRTRVHRVVSSHHRDAYTLLQILRERGYVRPGLITQPEWEMRSDHGYTSAYLLFQDRVLGGARFPVLRLPEFDGAVVTQWLKRYEPDVVIIHQPPAFFRAFEAMAAAAGLSVPRDLGTVFLGVDPHSDDYAGMAQNHERIGICGLELLVGRMQQRAFGLPDVPKIEFVEGTWVEGRTVRPR